MSQHFDAIIIGTAQAGPPLAERFVAAGITVAIIERHKFGGTCVNTGCIPTKTLVASAYAAHVARRGAEYGFNVNGDVLVDMKRVKARKDEISGRSNKGVPQDPGVIRKPNNASRRIPETWRHWSACTRLMKCCEQLTSTEFQLPACTSLMGWTKSRPTALATSFASSTNWHGANRTRESY